MCVLHLHQQIKTKKYNCGNGPANIRVQWQKILKIIIALEKILLAIKTFFIGISTTFQLARSLCRMLFTEATFSDNKTTIMAAEAVFPVMETKKKIQEPAFQPLSFLEIRCSHNFSISMSSYHQAKFASKMG